MLKCSLNLFAVFYSEDIILFESLSFPPEILLTIVPTSFLPPTCMQGVFLSKNSTANTFQYRGLLKHLFDQSIFSECENGLHLWLYFAPSNGRYTSVKHQRVVASKLACFC